jgi:putative transposase
MILASVQPNRKIILFAYRFAGNLAGYRTPLAWNLISMARQSACERAWTGISRFFDACKAKKPGKKGYPRFQKNNRSVEYKTTGWKLSEDRKSINFTDGHKIGLCKLIGSRDLNFYQPEPIKRVRIVRRADGYYTQFSMDAQPAE